MSAVEMEDAEADLADAVREALGDDTLVSTSMDLHGNVSQRLLDAVDLITCYRMAPHEDSANTKERAVHNLLRQLRSSDGADTVARRPYKAWIQVPVLLPGEKTSTRIDPGRSIYRQVAVVEALPQVLDAAIWVGYAWADEPRCQAAVVVTGFDERIVRAKAGELAQLFWDSRADFMFVADALPLDQCLDAALAPNAARPFLVSDSGDNPTAGGAGDVSWPLARLLQRSDFASGAVRVVHASIFDSRAVAAARALGVGATIDIALGGRIDSRPSGPVRMSGEIVSISEGDPVAGTQVVIRQGGVYAIVTERRKPFHRIVDFTQVGLDLANMQVIVVKIGYLEPELYDLAADWKLALTPGGVDQDLIRLGHQRLAAGVFPFADTAVQPTLDVTVRRRGCELLP